MFNNQRYSGSVAQGFMQKVYGWMCAGLAVTAAVSYYLSPEVNPVLFKSLMSNMFVVIALGLASFGLLMYMSMSHQTLNYSTMSLLFMVFCGLQGIFLAPVLYVYTASSVFYVFIIAAAMFGTMALYGWFTNADLSSMSNILFMGLIGLIIANLINMFVQSARFDMVIASFGVGIFAMLTAYDVQNLKKYSQYGVSSSDQVGKFALLGAMSLYLNLINLFLYLLRLFGEKRRD
ncbi:Bax inhibitor-1/YccA family protein [Candidatus Babeliales bacterium]|nr:Bax inhibitor-1/YccA family protein [Candidatus Babeliales bacterium]